MLKNCNYNERLVSGINIVMLLEQTGAIMHAVNHHPVVIHSNLIAI